MKTEEEMEREIPACEECGKKLDLENNEYHKIFRTCDQYCYMHMVGMSMSDFI